MATYSIGQLILLTIYIKLTIKKTLKFLYKTKLKQKNVGVGQIWNSAQTTMIKKI